jgi:hypothetical protein
VGLVVGIAGIGGAALMTPFLILVAGVRPVVAVGTDLAYGAITKAVGSLVHHRQGTVDPAVAWRLGLGSIPAGLVGIGLLSWLGNETRNGMVDQFVSRAVGCVLIIVAVSLLLRPWLRRRAADRLATIHTRKRTALTMILGAGTGLLVGLTSVGSGSLIAACLITVYPEMPPRRVVGTDIFHAMCLTMVTGLAHYGLGTVDVPLLGRLLLGSVPGVWLGSRLATTLPDGLLRPVMAGLLGLVGYKLF